jgi:hypothetical protein
VARSEGAADAGIVDGKAWHTGLAQQPQTSRRASGPVPVARPLYRPAAGGTCLGPLALRAGIIAGLSTLGRARPSVNLRSHMPADEPSALCTELGISGPSRSRCARRPKLLSAVWASHRERGEDARRPQEVVPAEASVGAVSWEGVMVPAKEAQREATATREAAKTQGWSTQPSGPAGSREVGWGPGTLSDEDAQRLATGRYGCAPASKKQTLTAHLEAARASRLARRPDWAVVAVADGAEENGRYCERPVDAHATKIVDDGHASPPLRAVRAADDGAKTVTGRAE